MIHLRTLGALDLRGSDGREFLPILAQPKRFALLTYLAFADSQRFRRRDTILALFWPDLDQEHARSALRQAVWFLRRSLGRQAITSRSEEELGINQEVLRCDAVDFARECEEGHPVEALELYRGGFLDGFFVTDASHELEHWVEEERCRLRHLAAGAAWLAAEQQDVVGDHLRAAEYGRRAGALLPDDESSVRRLIQLLDRLGDRAEAVRVYEDFAARLKADLDLTPAPETRALVQAVRSREMVGPAVDRLGIELWRQREAGNIRPVAISESLGVRGPAGRPWVRRRIAALAASLGLAGVTAITLWPDPGALLDPNLVAVAPFRVAGSGDLSYLREGMVDLLGATITGEGGPRTLDPAVVLHAWRQSTKPSAEDLAPEAATRVARSLGAGRLIRGAVVGDLHRLVITASLQSVPDGRVRGSARAEGSADSLAFLVDQITAQLLAGEAGVRERVAGLTSLPALRAYLEGRAAHRLGRFREAEVAYARALQIDSAFALAALGLVFLGQTGVVTDYEAAARLAWAAREQLSSRDQGILMAHVGPNYPSSSTLAEFLQAREAAVRIAPDRPEAWHWLADFYFHYGNLLRVDDPLVRAKAMFLRALTLDSLVGPFSASVEPILHLIDMAFQEGDVAEAKRLIGLFASRDSAGRIPDSYRWWLAHTEEDTLELASLRRRLNELSDNTLEGLIFTAEKHGVGVGDAIRAAEIIQARPATSEERNARVFSVSHPFELNIGRPSRAGVALKQMREPIFIPHLDLYLTLMDDLFWDGDTAAAKAAAHRLMALAAAANPSDSVQRAVRYTDRCMLGLWWVHQNEVDLAAQMLGLLRVAEPTGTFLFTGDDKALCVAMLEASTASARGLPGSSHLVAALDSLVRRGPSSSWRLEATLILARLYEQIGNTAAALDAIRRRPTDSPSYASTFLHEEGRLSAVLGDTVAAKRAYRLYLKLRQYPEAELLPEARRVQEELSILERGVA